MALKKEISGAGAHAEEVFGALNESAPARKQESVLMAARLPKAEKERLERLFARYGLKISDVIKIGLYRVVEELESGKLSPLEAAQAKNRLNAENGQV